MNHPSRARGDILFIDREPLPDECRMPDLGDKVRLIAVHEEQEALRLLCDHKLTWAVIVANHHMLSRLESDCGGSQRMRHREAVRLLLTDGEHPADDFAAINRAGVFRVLLKPLNSAAVTQHLCDALKHHARQHLASTRREDKGLALRDTLAFLAHEINTPLSLVQGYARAMLDRAGVFSAEPAPTGMVKQALEATERSARQCLSLTALITNTARQAFPETAFTTSRASDVLRALLRNYPFEGQGKEVVSLVVEQDVDLPSSPELLYMACFVLVDHVLRVQRTHPRPLLRIVLGVHGEAHPPRPDERLDAGLMFCQRVMRTLHGELHLTAPSDRETVAILDFGHVAG